MLLSLTVADQIQAAPSGSLRTWPLLLITVPVAAFYTGLVFTARGLTARFPLGGERPGRNAAIHAGAALAFGVAYYALYSLVAQYDADPTELTLFFYLGGHAVLYALAAGATHAAEYARRSRRAEVAELRLRTELAEAGRQRAEAELRALRVELNPHIIGNALTRAAALVRDDPVAAERTLAGVGEAMRAVVAPRPADEVTLEDEIEGLGPFLAIERARIGGPLALTWDIDPEALGVRVPDMILQPLVESAVRPGSRPVREGPLTVAARRVRGSDEAEQLEVNVFHDAGALSAAELEQVAGGAAGGVMANARARIAQLYGSQGTISLEPGAGLRGVVARLTLPWNDVGDEAFGSAPGARARNVAEIGARAVEPTSGADGDAELDALSGPQGGPRLAAAALAWFVAVWALGAGLAYDIPEAGGTPPTLGAVLAAGLLTAAFWTVVPYAALRLTRSYPIHRPHAGRNIALHVGVAGLVAVMGAARKALGWVISGPVPDTVLVHLVVNGIGKAVIYILLVVAAHGVLYAHRYRRSQAEGLRLEAEVAEAGRRRVEAEVRALRAELNPHFLGNALHAAAALVRHDPAAAERVLAQLSELLGRVAARGTTPEVPLEEELVGLEPFVAIEQARLGGRLRVTHDIDPAALVVRVPDMILQPLVENAVRHGIAARSPAAEGQITISARRRGAGGEWLELSVTDDGVGPGASAAARGGRHSGGGVGLANVRARLSELYGPGASLELAPGPGGTGTVARLTLPWRTANGAAAGLAG